MSDSEITKWLAENTVDDISIAPLYEQAKLSYAARDTNKQLLEVGFNLLVATNTIIYFTF